ncbi:ABC transporter ATP-binding protein [Saccharococcus caldoxylosilyticus]|uniref:Putative ABC transporter ATP-binding/permease protein n=1 Tax=Parageobacillus caldoxylosilyticus NBRC 107762 TaxID=1220594 RepID=A0A023DHG8_9BACL|nr:ABC transporter ATP-binding protein [Parageobacillus caldoxylosilyticus]OQP03102.1 ABC transporter ATP-binding protein [Geobacillus sp. 44B]MBB3853624.1 ATP-binding cassette subfamily B protein [Parageobacillus caldoxylosilyticus]QNU37314.1 ABC transporter ATP-binding protein [Geobacillus sp. 44B]BDG43264.1 putative ABC transporter ATP-binding protein YfiB [Parageobacillus caldoxylosilyticus]GAJ40421.1 putative ABC transporter ATP-binding/permease protein [Parageobacillus caldoxylosilyticus
MRQILLYLKPYRKWMIIAWMLMLIELLVELWQPLLMGKIIDDGVMKQNLSVVWTWGAVMIGASLLAFASGIANSFAAAYVGQECGFSLRKHLFEKIQSFSFANVERFSTASLITRLTNDVTQVQNMVFMSLRIALRAPLLVVFSVAMSLIVHVQLALMFVVAVPILVAFLLWMMNKAAASFSIVQQALDRVNSVMRENLAGMRLIKAWMRGVYEQERFMTVNESLMQRTMNVLRLVETITPVLLFVMNMAIIVILFVGRVDIKAGSATAGQVVAVVNYATRITAALSMFTFITMAFSRAKASAGRIADVLQTEVEMKDGHEGGAVPIRQGEIRFERVSFRYPNSRTLVLKDISFVVRPHETVAILGATGSGKTSLLQLIPRLYDPTDGRVLIDGVDIRQVNQEQLRTAIRFVPQEVLLFSGTIAENIRFGNANASMEEVIKAAKHAQIHDTIMSFPDGYETVIGQKGVNLSGGQKQRLSIARALVGHPKILLLDDSTSALDLKTEAKLLEALKEYTCTTLIVTQKIRTAMEADVIFLLEDGQLLAKGSHDELLEKSELYRKIVESQFGKKGLNDVTTTA